MITIVEGCDGTGKTTFAKNLAKINNLKYLHAEKPTTNYWYTEYLKPVNSTNMVLDRWHLGEIVWPEIYGRESLFSDPESFDICNWTLAKLGARLLLFVRRDDDIADELLKRGEEKEIEHVLKAKDLFLDAYKKVKYMDKTIIESGTVHAPNN